MPTMTSERWQRVKDILVAVDGMESAERHSALDDLCRDDADLRAEVDSLLAQEDRIAVLNEPADHPAWFGLEPSQAGPYRIERLLGAGGMGAVYLATRSDQVFEKQVAVKIIQSLRGEHLARRFAAERRILARLEHPAIARLLDGGALDDGRPYLVMEYVEGLRIDEYVDRQKLTPNETLRLFLKVCAGVQYAHQNLVVHRDLKPGNILVTAEGEPRLLDFGIARILTSAVEGNADRTLPFERLLTPSSASPEQVSDGAVTTASDVYSLGLLLYRLLTGISPYAGARNFRTDPNAVILHYDPPLASRAAGIAPERARLLRGDLEMIVAKALEKDLSRRYQTVEELAAEIHRYLDGRPIKARRNSSLYVARRFIRRNRLPVAAAFLLLLAIAGGIAGTVLYARRAERQKQLAEQRLNSLRRLGESLLFEFHDSIKDLPGSTQARALVVQRAIDYLDQVAAEDPDDPAVQRDLAAGYVRIGPILAGERGAHIGGPDARVKAMEGYEKALAIRRRLLAAHPEDPALRTELLESLWAVAYGRRDQGRIDEGIQLLNERLNTIDASPQKGTFNLQYSLAATNAGLSEMYRIRGDGPKSLDFAHRALEIRQALLTQNPTSARAQRAVGLSWDTLGYALSGQDRYAEAAQAFQSALAVFTPLAAASPNSADMQRNLEVGEMDICEALTRSGHAPQAVPHCRRSISIADSMRRADPQNVQGTEDSASAYGTLAFALHRAGDTRAALSSARQADALFQAALAQDPDAGEAAAQYSDLLGELAAIEHELHAPSACGHLSKARDILKRLASATPGDATVRKRTADLNNANFCP